MLELHGRGDVVERQSYLNGTKYVLLEGSCAVAGDEWTWTLAITMPKEEGESIDEGDLSIVSTGRSWYADSTGGSFSETTDQETEEELLDIRLDLIRRDDSESSESWLAARAHVSIRADECTLALKLCGPT